MIKSLTECIYDFIQTEEGKQVLINYILENNLYDEELIKEMMEFNEKHK